LVSVKVKMTISLKEWPCQELSNEVIIGSTRAIIFLVRLTWWHSAGFRACRSGCEARCGSSIRSQDPSSRRRLWSEVRSLCWSGQTWNELNWIR